MSDEVYEEPETPEASEPIEGEDTPAIPSAEEPGAGVDELEEAGPTGIPGAEPQVEETATQLTMEDETAEDIAQVMADLESEEPDEQTAELADNAPVEPAPQPVADASADSDTEPVSEAPAEPVGAVQNLADEPAATRITAPAWPFIIHGGLWAVFAGLLAYFLLGLPGDVATYEADQYPLFLFAGLVLTAAGPFLILAVWLAIKGRSSDKFGSFISALYRGAVATMGGVVLWWIVLLAVDQVRLGRLF